MKRIVIDGRMGQFGRVGIAEYFSNLVRAISRSRSDVELHIIQAKGCPDAPSIVDLNCIVHRIAPSYGQYGKREWWEQIELPRFLNHIQADVYHSPNYYLPFIGRTSAALVVTFYDASLFATPKYYTFVHRAEGRFLIKRSAKRANAIVFGSRHAQIEYGHFLGESVAIKGRAIYIGLPAEVGQWADCSETDIAAVKRKFELTRPYIVAVGSVHPRKNYERLIHSMSLPELHGLNLVICGAMAWKTAGVFEAIRKHGLENRVKVTGFVETPDMVALVKGAEVMAFPSLYEGFGIPPLEAFALGVPVCASNSSSIPEVVGDAALLFDPLSVEEIAASLARVVTDRVLRAELVARGRIRLGLFSWEKCAQEHLEVYRQAMERR